MPKTKRTFFYVVGPTATGKSNFAMALAKKLQLPIINCDSVQVFKKVKIGTAAPSEQDFAEVEHHLFSYVEPPQSLTASDYLKDVVQTLEDKDIAEAIFVGGSGFYLQALEKGLYPKSEVSEETTVEVDKIMEEKGADFVFQWVAHKDPQFAKKISPNDHYRLKRAMGVMKTQNLSMTELKGKMATENHSLLPPHRAIKLGFNDERSELRARVTLRTEKMLASGWSEEVRELREQGLAQWAPMMSVGYKEVQAFLDGTFNEAELSTQIVTATMQLIKKQQTWFKRDAEIHWFRPGEIQEALDWSLQQAKGLSHNQ